MVVSGSGRVPFGEPPPHTSLERPPRTAGVNRTYKQAPRALKKVAEPMTLFELDPDA